MAKTYVSLTMALPKNDIPERLTSLEDLALIYKDGEALYSFSRKNWLIGAVEACASHYRCRDLSYLSHVVSLLSPTEVNLAAEALSGLVEAIAQDPMSLCELLGQNAWSAQEIRAILHADASPWGPLIESDDGDELPYLLSFLTSQLALLKHSIEHNFHVAFAQTSPDGWSEQTIQSPFARTKS